MKLINDPALILLLNLVYEDENSRQNQTDCLFSAIKYHVVKQVYFSLTRLKNYVTFLKL